MGQGIAEVNKWTSYNTAWLAQRGCEANCAWKGVARRSSSHSVRDNGWRMTSGGTRRAKPRWARPGATSPAAGEIQRTRLVAQEQHGNFSAELAPEANAWDFPQRPPRCRLLGDLALSQGGIRLQGPPVAPLPPLAPPGCDAAGAWSSCTLGLYNGRPTVRPPVAWPRSQPPADNAAGNQQHTTFVRRVSAVYR